VKTALVTGAAGFIGSHVVRELLSEGVHVRCLVRPGERTDNLDGLVVEIREGDVRDPAAVGRAVKGVDTVFHLAAVYAIWMPDWSKIYEVNVQGSRNVLWACLRGGVGRVVFTSSIAAIGIAPGRGVSSEKTPFNQYTLGSHYVLTKYLSQQEALGFAANGLDVVVVNPCFPFGPMDIAPTPTGQIIVDILRGVSRFSFPGGINVVDVRDVARGHICAARRGKTGELYVLGNRNIAMDDFVRLVCRVAGIDGRIVFKVPVPLMKIGTAALSWLSDHVTRRPPLSTPVEIAYASQYLYFDNTKAVTELGMSFRDVEASIAESVAWFRSRGYA